MTLRVLVIVFSILTWSTASAELTEISSDNAATFQLEIWGDENVSILKPLFAGFQHKNPDITILYRQVPVAVIHAFLLRSNRDFPDIVMTTAMSDQFKLAHDGFAAKHESPLTESLPDWAKWRNEIFAYAVEPIVTVINSDLLGNRELPRNRQQFIQLFDDKRAVVMGKIGTPAFENNDIGYMAWSIDRQQSATYGRMLQSFRESRVKTYPDSSALLQALLKGDIFVAYNVVGGYAFAWEKRYPWIKAVLPTDYTSLVSRTVLITQSSKKKTTAGRFIDFLVGPEGQSQISEHTTMTAIGNDTGERHSFDSLRILPHGIFRNIAIDLPLLLYTDQAKRNQIISEFYVNTNRGNP